MDLLSAVSMVVSIWGLHMVFWKQTGKDLLFSVNINPQLDFVSKCSAHAKKSEEDTKLESRTELHLYFQPRWESMLLLSKTEANKPIILPTRKETKVFVINTNLKGKD